jgi:hypothetical protein
LVARARRMTIQGPKNPSRTRRHDTYFPECKAPRPVLSRDFDE